MTTRSPVTRAFPLTEREYTTLERVARGITHEAIAAELGISVHTVSNLAGTQLSVTGRPAAPYRPRIGRYGVSRT